MNKITKPYSKNTTNRHIKQNDCTHNDIKIVKTWLLCVCAFEQVGCNNVINEDNN